MDSSQLLPLLEGPGAIGISVASKPNSLLLQRKGVLELSREDVQEQWVEGREEEGSICARVAGRDSSGHSLPKTRGSFLTELLN